MTEQADVIVVGMGPGGEDVAGRLAEAGLDVVGIEAELVGRGVPLLGLRPLQDDDPGRRSAGRGGAGAGHGRGGHRAPRLGPGGPAHPGGGHRLVGRHGGGQAVRGQGGRLVRGWGRLEGPSRVVVGDRVIEASRAVVINIGTRAGSRRWPAGRHPVLDQPGGHRDRGGARLAGRARRWGHRGRAGPGVPPLRFRGDRARGGAVAWSAPRSPRPGRCWPRSSGPRASTSAPGWPSSRSTTTATASPSSLGAGEPVVAERLLVATGRRPDLAQLNVASLGLDSRPGALPVDDHMRVEGVEGVWAVGDVTGKGAFTHMSMYQADIVVNDILGHRWSRPTTGPSPGSPSPIRRSARWAERAGGPRRQGLAVRVGTAEIPKSDPGMDPQGRQPGVHQAGRGRRAGRAGRGHVGRAVGRRGPRPAHPGRPRRGADHRAPAHDLRLPDLPPGHRGRRSRTSSAS